MRQAPVFLLVNDLFACCGLRLLIWINHSRGAVDIITSKSMTSIKNLHNFYKLSEDTFSCRAMHAKLRFPAATGTLARLF